MNIQVTNITELPDGGAELDIEMDDATEAMLAKEAKDKGITIEELLVEVLQKGINDADKDRVRKQQ